MRLISIRSNQTFDVNYENNQLSPTTEIIILVTQPKYDLKGKQIVRSNELKELRFETDTEGINALIGQLNQALKVSNQYSQMGSAMNEIIKNSKPSDDSTVS